MKKILITLILGVVIVGCTATKVINGKEQTFTEFVILNKSSNFEGGWENLDSDCFPLLRLEKWLEN